MTRNREYLLDPDAVGHQISMSHLSTEERKRIAPVDVPYITSTANGDAWIRSRITLLDP